jgi:hypothetical protein
MQTVTDEDGTVHQFPDDATPDEINTALGSQKTGGATPSPAAGSPNATADQPSYASQLVGQLAKPLRAFNKGLTGGLWDPAVGGVKSLFGAGSPAQERAQTASGEAQMGPGASIALEGAGMLTGPGKLAQTENAAAQAPGFVNRLLTRLGGGAAEGSTYAGVNAAANQQPVVPAMEKGALIGGPTAVAAPVVTAAASKIAGKIPESIGGPPTPPDVPTSSSVVDPRRYGGYAFPSNADKLASSNLSVLENLEANAKLGTGTLGNQIKSLFDKNPLTGTAPADAMGLTDAQADALKAVPKAAPIASGMVAHPRITQGAVGAVTELPAMALGLHGNIAEAMATESMGIGGHVAAAYLPVIRQAAAQQAALNAAKYKIAGIPVQTTSSLQDALNSPDSKQALQALMFNRTLNQ